MQNLGQLLQKKFKAPLDYFGAVQLISKNWAHLVGDLAQFLKPKNIYKNELVVACSNPSWMSEVDFFKDTIVEKCNALLKKSRNKVTLKGIKAVIESEEIVFEPKQSLGMPKEFSDRIQFNIKNKQSGGAKLCKQCQKIWDKQDVCKICQLTSGQVFENIDK